MRLLYLSGATIGFNEAYSVAVMRMCEAFAGLGHEVRLVAAGYAPTLMDAALAPATANEEHAFAYYGIEPCFQLLLVPRAPTALVGQALYNLRAALAVRSDVRPDLVYARDRVLATLAPKGVPLVFEAHQVPLGARRVIERAVLARRELERLVFISKGLQCDYREALPGSLSVPALIAPSGHTPRPSGSQTLDIQRRVDRLAVGYLGSAYAGRGISLLLTLAERHPHCDFFLALADSSIARGVARRAQQLANLSVVAALQPAQTDGFCRQMDVLVAPYQRRVIVAGGTETTRWMSPLKLVEYMAAGKAIVASDLPATRELLEHEKTALLVAPDDVEAWSRALVTLASETRRAQLGRAAEKRFARSLTWSQRARAVLDGLG